MKLLFIQLSDIHWQDSFGEYYSERFELIGSALSSNFVEPIDAVIFLYGGDFVYSGREEEYDEVYIKLRTAEKSVRETFGDQIKYFSIGVPGNHDCDFSGDQSARDGILKGLNSADIPQFSGSYCDVLLGPQESFFEFLDVLCGGSPDREQLIKNVDSRLAWKHTISLAEGELNIVCFNSAWLSRLKEKKGHLVLPTGKIETKGEAALQVSLVHHPISWLETSNSELIRKQVFSISDLIFTGHEHVRNTVRSELEGVGMVASHEASAFIPETENEEAGFTALYIDTVNHKETKLSFLWEKLSFVPYSGGRKIYPSEPVLPLEFTPNIYRRNRKWEFSESMKIFLENPEIEIRRGEQTEVPLSSIYVSPDLRELSSESNYEKAKTIPGATAVKYISEKTAVFVIGPDQSGKSAMAKMVALHLKAGGNLPLLVSGAKIPLKPESFKPLIAELVSAHYGVHSVEDFFASPLSDRVLLVDDYQFLQPALRKDHTLVDLSTRFFGRILVFCHDAELTPYELGKLSLRIHPRINVVIVPPLTYQRRHVLIDRWLRLSPNYGNDGASDQKKEVECHRLVNAIVANYIQPFPAYVLSILQSIESGNEVDLSASTHGHLYEVFIKAALAKRSTLTNYNVISAFLATLAIASFEQEKQSFGDEFIQQSYQRFREETDLERDLQKMKTDLIKLRLISCSDGEYRFREKYIY